MTYFLAGRPEQELEQVDQAPSPQSLGAGLTASYKLAQLRDGSNFGQSTRIRTEIENRALSAIGRMDRDVLDEQIRKRGLYTGGLLLEESIKANPKVAATVIHLAREQARQNPDAWTDLSLTDDDIYNTVQKATQAERDELEAILAASPPSPVLEALAGMAGATMDVKNLPFLLLGAGPTGAGIAGLARVAVREAAINTVAEAAFLPDRFEMAEVLDEADPNVLQTLTLAATIGAGFGVVVGAAERAANYRIRRDGLDGSRTLPEIAAIDRVEDALGRGNLRNEARTVAEQEALLLRSPTNVADLGPLQLRNPQIEGVVLPEGGSTLVGTTKVTVNDRTITRATLNDGTVLEIEGDAPPARVKEAVAQHNAAQPPRQEPQPVSPEVDAVPDTAFAPARQEAVDAVLRADVEEVRLADAGFTPEEIAPMEAAGFATEGRMSRPQYDAWSEEGTRRSAPVEPVAAPLRPQVPPSPQGQPRASRAGQAGAPDEAVVSPDVEADLFDDPTSPQSAEMVDSMLNDIRETADDFDDIEVDGVSVAQILDEIEQDEIFVRELELCMTGGARGPQ